MAENTKKTAEDDVDLDVLDPVKVNEQLTAEARAKVEKNQLIEKQNTVGKRLLRLLPFHIFMLVSEADGKTDNKEVGQFREFLNRREKHTSNAYTRRMFHTTVVNYTALTNRYLGGHIKKDFKVVQQAMNYMQIAVSQPVMKEICKDLRELAVAIAEASGGFLSMTTPISPEEGKIIEKLDQIFEQAMERARGDDIPNNAKLDF
jgi:hypothetical protein